MLTSSWGWGRNSSKLEMKTNWAFARHCNGSMGKLWFLRLTGTFKLKRCGETMTESVDTDPNITMEINHCGVQFQFRYKIHSVALPDTKDTHRFRKGTSPLIKDNPQIGSWRTKQLLLQPQNHGVVYCFGCFLADPWIYSARLLSAGELCSERNYRCPIFSLL